jgi:hypothetical protein
MSNICDHERASAERRLTELKADLYALDDRHPSAATRANRLREILREMRQLNVLLDRRRSMYTEV